MQTNGGDLFLSKVLHFLIIQTQKLSHLHLPVKVVFILEN